MDNITKYREYVSNKESANINKNMKNIEKILANIEESLTNLEDMDNTYEYVKEIKTFKVNALSKNFRFENGLLKFNMVENDENILILDGDFVITENNNIQIKGTFVNGKLNGNIIIYRFNGEPNKIMYNINIKDGKLDGEYKEYYKNGNLEYHKFYKDGELDGEYKRYYENENLKYHKFYKDGKEISKKEYEKSIGLFEENKISDKEDKIIGFNYFTF